MRRHRRETLACEVAAFRLLWPHITRRMVRVQAERDALVRELAGWRAWQQTLERTRLQLWQQLATLAWSLASTSTTVRLIPSMQSEHGCSSEEDTHPSLMCPIGWTLMHDPVIAADGHSYERAAICHWLELGNTLSPLSGQPLPDFRLLPNHALRNGIEELLEKSADNGSAWAQEALHERKRSSLMADRNATPGNEQAAALVRNAEAHEGLRREVPKVVTAWRMAAGFLLCAYVFVVGALLSVASVTASGALTATTCCFAQSVQCRLTVNRASRLCGPLALTPFHVMLTMAAESAIGRRHRQLCAIVFAWIAGCAFGNVAIFFGWGAGGIVLWIRTHTALLIKLPMVWH